MSTNSWTLHTDYHSEVMQMDAALLTTYNSLHPRQDTYHVDMTTGHFGYRIRVADQKLISVQPGGLGWVFQADLTNADNTTLANEASYELTPVIEGASHTLLLLKSHFESCFYQDRSRPHFKETETWIGADGPGLLVQAGIRRAHPRKQLFRLVPGESILFIDSHREVTKITAGEFGEVPTTIRATEGEVANYVLGEVQKRGQGNPKTRAWCFYALQELGCQQQIDAFNQLFPDFHRK